MVRHVPCRDGFFICRVSFFALHSRWIAFYFNLRFRRIDGRWFFVHRAEGSKLGHTGICRFTPVFNVSPAFSLYAHTWCGAVCRGPFARALAEGVEEPDASRGVCLFHGTGSDRRRIPDSPGQSDGFRPVFSHGPYIIRLDRFVSFGRFPNPTHGGGAGCRNGSRCVIRNLSVYGGGLYILKVGGSGGESAVAETILRYIRQSELVCAIFGIHDSDQLCVVLARPDMAPSRRPFVVVRRAFAGAGADVFPR